MSQDVVPPRTRPTVAKVPRPEPVFSSDQLFGRQDTVWIEHGGQRYALRRTRQGKLILTK